MEFLKKTLWRFLASIVVAIGLMFLVWWIATKLGNAPSPFVWWRGVFYLSVAALAWFITFMGITQAEHGDSFTFMLVSYGMSGVFLTAFSGDFCARVVAAYIFTCIVVFPLCFDFGAIREGMRIRSHRSLKGRATP